MTPNTIAALAAVAGVAGFVDAIAGGGGLLTVPALLAAGLDPHLALGTNKGQSIFGTAAALRGYWRAKLVDRPLAPRLFAFALVGSAAGASLLRFVSSAALKPIVLGLLGAAALLLLARPTVGRDDAERAAPGARTAAIRAAAIALGLGAYDGFFGPGTGTFVILGFALALAQPLTRATANAKVVNFASNLAALVTFAVQGHVLFRVALPMAAAQIVGGSLGARVTSARGSPLVRGVVVAVSLALCVKLGWDLVAS